MSWPYHIYFLNEQQTHERRLLLDRYGIYAQLSALIPIVIYNLYRLAIWVYSERQRSKVDYEAVPSSPTLKKKRTTSKAAWGRKWRGLTWWLQGEVRRGWGERGHWIAAGLWGCWLGFLCVHKTGDDYLHITKRFGVIAVSQFPVHYALSMKSLHSPLAILFGSSHEQLNTWHRISGRVIWTLLLCHASWYLNLFIQAGTLSKRLKAPVVIFGIISFQLLNILIITSSAAVRRWSYRTFFISHLLIAITIIPLLFFHSPVLRIYIIEALSLFIIDLFIRKLTTFTAFTTISAVPKTSLVKLTLPIPESKLPRFKAAPGQHIYLSIPPSSVPTTSKISPHLHEFMFNPFTVSSVSTLPSPHITLTLRTLNGPTTSALSALSHLNKARPPINIEGPYGTSRKFPNLAERFDKVLLVAGGVGATFILPIYRAIKEEMEIEGRRSGTRMIWCMRDEAEASWAFNKPSKTSTEEETEDAVVDEETKEDINEDGIEIFITSLTNSHEDREQTEPGSVEMHNLQSRIIARRTYSRPDLGKIVDETFAHGLEERVAVLVCGPHGMAAELREHVGRWVDKGRYVWWHDESFGW